MIRAGANDTSKPSNVLSDYVLLKLMRQGWANISNKKLASANRMKQGPK